MSETNALSTRTSRSELEKQLKITVIKPSFAIMTSLQEVPEFLEWCGRTCYKSEAAITEGSSERFVSKICRNRHESVLEHASVTVRIVCSRACSHQLVRHRIGAYSQESQRYVNYAKKGYEVILPPKVGAPIGEYELRRDSDGILCYDEICNFDEIYGPSEKMLSAMFTAFEEYEDLLDEGVKPEDARFVLPNACKTELVVTYNMRTWRHVFRERGLNAHAQWEIREIFKGIYDVFKVNIPSVFGDLEE